MKALSWGFLATALVGVASCAGGEQVALNERFFALESMQSVGGGCSLYMLGSGEDVRSSYGAVEGGLVVRQRLDGDQVVVSIDEGDRSVVERRYGESFFAAGTLDEFNAVPSSGSGGLVLRYWGRLHPNGTDGCAPLDAPGP